MCVYLYEQGQILGEFCCVLPRVIYVHCQRLGCDLALERFCLLWFCLQNIKFNKLSMESCLNTKADWSVPPSLPLQGACKPLVRCQRIPLGKIHYSCIVKCFHLCSCSHNQKKNRFIEYQISQDKVHRHGRVTFILRSCDILRKTKKRNHFTVNFPW